ncbi:MAG: hypothetical protein CW691_04880 [Candidatus Bathyarchaeum sp.]|nr:MAG: hypothetical protein CW691_04880 [Candidatus Bathyarchaeum sp.]
MVKQKIQLVRSVNPISKQLDHIDKIILVSLLKDSRKKFTEIAKECAVSASNIKNRYNEIKKAGIIKDSTIIVNVNKLGYQGHLSLYVNVKFDEVKKFIKYTNKIPGIITYHVKLNENYNVAVLLPIKNMREIEYRKEQIKNHPAVINVKANIWTEIKTIPENLSALHF